MKEFLETLYQALAESTDDFIYMNDCQTGVFQYPGALTKLFAFPKESRNAPLSDWKKIVHPDDWERFYHSHMEIMQDLREELLVEFRAKNRKGEYVWLKSRGKVLRDRDGNQMLFTGTISLMGRQSKVDSLTQLFNHAEFYMKLKQDLQSEKMTRMAVLMVDVDEFRQINEMYGRAFGDGVLKELGQLLQSVLPKHASLFRLEKDRMGILMADAGRADARIFYSQFQEYLAKINPWKQYCLDIELSAGCAVYPADGSCAEELYRYTDCALQTAKEQGKNRLVFFTEDIFRKKERSLQLLRELKECVKQQYKGFYLHYQPQICPKTGELKGVEALMRWKSREGVISPAKFIPVMEEHGLIYEAGLWLFRMAVRDGKEWIKIKPDFTVSVNVSVLQFSEELFLKDLYQIIEEENFPCENLIIELTESLAFKQVEVFQKKFQDMKKRNIRIALDDFGTGYCSLSVLKNMPVDIVKIDKSFVKDIRHNQFDVALIGLVTEICHAASIGVCLEGVEEEEEYECIKEIPLDFIQGYYFGKPMGKNAISRNLRKKVRGGVKSQTAKILNAA